MVSLRKNVLENVIYKLLRTVCLNMMKLGPLVSIDKRNKSGQIINVEILENGWVRGKEDEKVTKYHCKRSAKHLGRKNKGYSNGSGSNSNNNNNNNNNNNYNNNINICCCKS